MLSWYFLRQQAVSVWLHTAEVALVLMKFEAAEMSSHKPPPVVTLCKDDPRFPFSDELQTVWRRGKFTDAAIAFLTEGGVEFFVRNCLNTQDRTRCRLCLTVQWPTNLDEVARRLSPLLGPNLRIFLGTKTPVESRTDVTPMLHSKVVYTDHGNGTCTAFVGSHNWTGNALNGFNCEASIRVECAADDPLAVEIRSHLDQCARLCVPFDPQNLTYYKALQRQLSTAQPPAPETEEVSAFQKLAGAPAVVIHAEGDESRYCMDKVMLFLPIKDHSTAKWFRTTRPQTAVFLFVYPLGSLFSHTPPSSRPVLFRGRAGQNNAVEISPSRGTDVTCEIRDFSRPVVQDISTHNIPPVKDELYQVVAELRRAGPVEIPVYHWGKQPILEVGVRFGDEPEEAGLFDQNERTPSVPTNQIRRPPDLVGRYDKESIRYGAVLFSEPMPERVINLDVPERWLYPENLNELVLKRLTRKQDQGHIRIALKPEKGNRAYFYRVSFVLER